MPATLLPSVDLAQQVAGAKQHFHEAYRARPNLAAAAPGRVNLIGEHTDYNDGYVLPIAIDRRTLILARRNDDHVVTLRSTHDSAPARFRVDEPLAPGEPSWANYVKGVIAGFVQRGLPVPGFDALIDSTVPVGGGLSSSAALEVATATLCEQLVGHQLADADKALLCQKAEHDFAGVPCGIMDQFISVMGQPGQAMLLDCRTREPSMVPLDDPAVTVLIVNSNVRHELADGEYAQRRHQCEQAAKALGVTALRDAELDLLEAHRGAMDDLVYQRARHVISENQRTFDAAGAMGRHDWTLLGELMFQSHASLREDYQVSCDELDLLVELASERRGTQEADTGVLGARMTGGGFGGCTVTLVATEQLQPVADHLCDNYQAATGITPTAFATHPAQGALVVML